ncbi:MAG: hypothetical protein GXP48_11425 [Acidobacteria bacterium]|nr:hypothetical protein [Acidobacteriota bacterium]
MTRSWMRTAAALVLLVAIAGVVVPCAEGISSEATTLSAAGSLVTPDVAASDCRCICHASWIPVQLTVCCRHTPLGRIGLAVVAVPEGSWLPPLGEPPRWA